MKYLIAIREKKFLKQSLCYYGILIQNHKSNHISDNLNLTLPYVKVNEGIVCDPYINKQINRHDNVVVVKNNQIVIEKRTTAEPVEVIFGNVLDLYDDVDRNQLEKIINEWEQTEKIYVINTEKIPKCRNTKSIAGLASGFGLAKMAYDSSANNIIFFDYKESSLKLQKELIEVEDRKSLLQKYLPLLTCGDRDANEQDINSLDFKEISKLYDNLKNKNITFLKIDFRNKDEIRFLIEALPMRSTLWISNVLHYITTLNYFSSEYYDFIETLCKKKLIKLLPYTKIHYEG